MTASLDLACPIPWRRSRGFAVGGDSGSESILGASHQDDHASSSRSNVEDMSTWTIRRYSETLWLGEQHSPLVGFLHHMQRLEQWSKDPLRCTSVIASLLRTRQSIRQRLSCSADSGGFASKGLIHALTQVSDDANEAIIAQAVRLHSSPVEIQIVRNALFHGPAQIVVSEALHRTDEGLGRFGRVWIDAIETREIQMQILVVLCLLQLYAKYPQLVHQERRCLGEVTNMPVNGPDSAPSLQNPKADNSTTPFASQMLDESPTQQRKRKRKADIAHRWTGGSNIFPWQVGRQSSRSMFTTRCDEEKEELTVSTRDLPRHFEALVDALCLRISTTSVSVDLDTRKESLEGESSSSSNALPRTPKQSSAVAAFRKSGAQIIFPPFGSEGRKRDSEKDERDVLQWFCCQVIEANFSKLLPRQCGTIRSRCYIPPAVTPAKMIGQTKKRDKIRSERDRMSKYMKTPHAGSRSHLHQSLHDENRQNVHHMRTSAATKRYTTWSAREVNVCRKWERSASLGPTTNAIKLLSSTSSDSHGKLPTMQALTKGQPSFAAYGTRKLAVPHTLVLDTPAKGRLMNFHSLQRAGLSQIPEHGDGLKLFDRPLSQTPLTTTSSSSWRRSESQPILTLDRSSIGVDERVALKANATGETDFDSEIVDASLQYDSSEEDVDGYGDREHDTRDTYLDWLEPSIETGQKINDAFDDGSRQTSTSNVPLPTVTDTPQAQLMGRDDDDEEEKLILSRKIRSLPPSSLWQSTQRYSATTEAVATVEGAQTSVGNSVENRTFMGSRGTFRLASPKRLPTGRNPFAKLEPGRS